MKKITKKEDIWIISLKQHSDIFLTLKQFANKRTVYFHQKKCQDPGVCKTLDESLEIRTFQGQGQPFL